MKFSLFPRQTRGLDLLGDLCTNIQGCVQQLSEILGLLAEDTTGQLAALERAESAALDTHYALLTQLRTSYVTPVPREDLYTFSRLLHDTVGELRSVGELMHSSDLTWISQRAADQLELIGRQATLTSNALGSLDRLDDLEDTWLQLMRVTKRVGRTHHAWVGETADLQRSSTIIRHRAVADQMLAASTRLHAVADHLGRVLVKES
ncbi:hypothetical protein GCM10022377_24880 [Zhihengliuella alba]|uniref:Nuclease PIN n=1 Tax=Zhihengliuella alba TaxID=547018 RepID=A0ABP7DW49_9MICC